jgi:hypothetical protein
MTNYIMSADLRNALLTFLGDRPLKKVAGLFNAVQAMKPLPEMKPAEVKEVPEQEKIEDKSPETFGVKK